MKDQNGKNAALPKKIDKYVAANKNKLRQVIYITNTNEQIWRLRDYRKWQAWNHWKQ